MEEIIQTLLNFRNERDWEQFHNPKDLAIAINIEAGELLELFLWKGAKDANKEKVKEELADIFAFHSYWQRNTGSMLRISFLRK